MKNSIIAVLGLVCLFFLLNALGAFQFGSFVSRDERTQFEAARTKAVGAAPAFRLGTAYDINDRPAFEAVQGIMLAAEMLNGTAQMKPIELQVKDSADSLPAYASEIQNFIEDPSVAAVIGPFSSGYIPTVRALSQFQGMPLVSPLTVYSEKLPPLDPDNFVSFFPPLELWVNAILNHMESKGFKKLLIISPETNTYGDIFSTALERAGYRRGLFSQIYRLNYQSPLKAGDIVRSVQNYTGERFEGAVFFGGTFADFPEFMRLVSEYALSSPIYGTDDLYVPQLDTFVFSVPLYLPHAVVQMKDNGFAAEYRKRFRKEPEFNTLLGAKTLFTLAEALNAEKAYSPEALVDSLRRILNEQQNDPVFAPRIEIDGFPVKGKAKLEP